MVETLSWLFDKVFFFVPRLQTVNQFEAAVFLRRGRHKTHFRLRRGDYRDMNNLKPGMYLLLPMVDEIYAMNKEDQVADLRCQSAWTKDGVDLAVSGAIHYKINTAYKALLHVNGVDRCLSRIALGVIVEYINQKKKEECHDIKGLCQEIHEGIKEAAGDWGLKIKKVQITDIGNAINLRHLMNEEDPFLSDDEE